MKPDFALDDSLTFNSVLPWSHFNTAGGKGNRDAASSKLLQEKVFSFLLFPFRKLYPSYVVLFGLGSDLVF